MTNCTKCNTDLSELCTYDALLEEYIICTKCDNKMILEYEDGWDYENEISNDESFWLIQYYE